MPKAKHKTSCTCQVVIGTVTDIASGTIEATDYVLVHPNGGRVAACSTHALIFANHGLTLIVAIDEIESGQAVWE